MTKSKKIIIKMGNWDEHIVISAQAVNSLDWYKMDKEKLIEYLKGLYDLFKLKDGTVFHQIYVSLKKEDYDINDGSFAPTFTITITNPSMEVKNR